MALICFASAGLLIFGLLFNADHLPVSKERRIISAAMIMLAGALYWFTASQFRVWMLHFIIVLELVWGFMGLTQMNSAIGSVMTILTIFWTCLLIGTTYRPPLARVYGGLVFLGMAFALRDSTANTAEYAMITLGFGLTMIVTLEILSQISSRLRDEATHDPLTGLLNRKGLWEAASRAFRAAMRDRAPLAIANFDLNDFKTVNDRSGHQAGDRLLVRCAEVWSANIRPRDVLARPGGDEFVLLLPGTEADEAEAIMRRLNSISPTSFSYGIAIADPGDSIESKLAEADAELIRAKAARRGFQQQAFTL